MATIDMTNKWDIRFSGISIDATIYPVVEIYFNLGYAVNEGDILDFGTRETFSDDMYNKIMVFSDSNIFLSAIGQVGNSSLPFVHFVDKTISSDEKQISIIQTQSEGGTASRTWIYQGIQIKDLRFNNSYIGVSYYNPSMHGDTKIGVSPVIVFHDLYSDNLLPVTVAGIAPVFGSDEYSEGTIKKINDFGAASMFDMKYPIGVDIAVTYTIALPRENLLVEIPPIDTDPYDPNGEHGGGDGEDQQSENVDDETLPTISAVDTGFVTLYKPSIGQLNSLAAYMWGALDLDVFKKVFANPMDVILGLSILPGIVPSGGSSSVYVGNINTGLSMTKVGNQYVKYDCGSVSVKRKWGAFLDYSPYTRAFIYLPFIGTHPIDVDEIMNKTVSVVYNIDVLSGGCCAFVKVGGTTLYTYIGQCAASVPVTGKDWSTMINGVLGAVSSVAGTIGSVASGNLMGAVSGVASIAQNVASAKPTYQRSGSMGGMGGMMGIKTPYIIIERPVQAVPGYQNQMIGYPAFVTKKMGSFSGYTEIEKCHLDDIPCTSDELTEIENILMSGVIF